MKFVADQVFSINCILLCAKYPIVLFKDASSAFVVKLNTLLASEKNTMICTVNGDGPKRCPCGSRKR